MERFKLHTFIIIVSLKITSIIKNTEMKKPLLEALSVYFFEVCLESATPLLKSSQPGETEQYNSSLYMNTIDCDKVVRVVR